MEFIVVFEGFMAVFLLYALFPSFLFTCDKDLCYNFHLLIAFHMD